MGGRSRSLRAGALAAAAAAALSAACATLDPEHDRAELAAAVRERTGANATFASDEAVGEEIRALLRSPLTADNAVRIALLNNQRVRATYERLGVARADLVQAGLLRNPSFDIAARFVDGGGTDLEFGASLPVLELFFRPMRRRLAEREFAAAKLRLTDELLHLVFDVQRRLVDVRAAEQLDALARQALAAATAAHELAVALHAAGNTTDQMLAVARAGESQARLDLAAAATAARTAREPVHTALGLWGVHTEWTLAGELPADPLQGLDLQHVEARAVAASLDLAAQREGLEALAQRVGLDSWRGWFPELDLGASGIRTPTGESGLGPRATAELPLLDTGRARRAGGEAKLRVGLHEHAQRAVEIRSQARLLRERCSSLAEQAGFLRATHLPLRAAVVHTTLQNYNAMQIGAFDVLQQRQLQLRDERRYVATLRAAHLARLDLQQLLAGLRRRRPRVPRTRHTRSRR